MPQHGAELGVNAVSGTTLPADVACLQARLDFYNSHQNLLTKWFTCEYATHFGLTLEGIARHRHPMPLGGTSTHFRTSAVRELGGWDAWNVTEDCELGMRLAFNDSYGVADGNARRTTLAVDWPTVMYAFTDYAGIEVSILDLSAPLAELSLRSPGTYKNQGNVALDIIRPRVGAHFFHAAS